MKKIILSTVLVAGLAAGASAQSLYLKLNGGVGLRAAGSAISANVDGSKTTAERTSLGAGWLMGGAVGYNVSDKLSAELGISFLSGFKQEFTNKQTSSTYTESWQTKQWRLTPSAVFRFGEGELQPYTRVGMIIPVKNKITTIEETQNSAGTPANVKVTSDLTTRLSLGWIAGIGVQKSLGERSAVFVEAGFQSLSLATKTQKATDYRVDGRDVMVDQKKYKLEYDFEKTLDNNGTFNENEPTKALRTFLPYSNFNLNIGLQINL